MRKPADNEIYSSRTLNAPLELVYQAFANPHHLKNWWGPEGFTNTIHEFDLQPGGKPALRSLQLRIFNNKIKDKLELNNIPNKIKYLVYGVCGLFFVTLYFGLGEKMHIGLIESIKRVTDYYFGFSSSTIDYLIMALIPVFGMLYNSKSNQFKVYQLIVDILTIVLSTILAFGFGLYIMTFIGRLDNPLIPYNIIVEPFYFYTTFTMLIGISRPFLFIRRSKKENEIENIGTQ